MPLLRHMVVTVAAYTFELAHVAASTSVDVARMWLVSFARASSGACGTATAALLGYGMELVRSEATVAAYSARALHEQPAFGFAVWGMYASLRGEVPLHALAAAQLAFLAVFSTDVYIPCCILV